MAVVVVMPEENMGPVAGLIYQRRGRIESMQRKGEMQAIEGVMALVEVFGYANVVRTLTHGRASFTMQFEHYEAVPDALAQGIIEKRRQQNLGR